MNNPPANAAAFLASLSDKERAEFLTLARDTYESMPQAPDSTGTRIKINRVGLTVKRKIGVVTSTIKHGAYKVGNTIHDLMDWITGHWHNYMIKHPTLHRFLSVVAAFTVGFVGFIVLYAAIISSVLLAAAFLPL